MLDDIPAMSSVVIDGGSLRIEDVFAVAAGEAKVKLSPVLNVVVDSPGSFWPNLSVSAHAHGDTQTRTQ